MKINLNYHSETGGHLENYKKNINLIHAYLWRMSIIFEANFNSLILLKLNLVEL